MPQSAMSTHFWNAFKDCDSTISLGSLFQCLTTLHEFFFLIPKMTIYWALWSHLSELQDQSTCYSNCKEKESKPTQPVTAAPSHSGITTCVSYWAGWKTRIFFSLVFLKDFPASKTRSHIILPLLEVRKPHLMLLNAIMIQIAKDHPCQIARFEDLSILMYHILLLLTQWSIQTH